jgi:ArsR family transcriptional regulator, zinc-responsive transcriptional repressor
MANTLNNGANARLRTGRPQGSVSSFAQAAECLKALAHPVRLRFVQMLLHGQYTVGELAADAEVQDNVASEHLRLLQRCGFLQNERDGRRVYYQIAEPHLQNLMSCIESRFLVGSNTGE